jgi:hypothetical protein
MVRVRRWICWAFVGFLVFYGPIFIFNNFYKRDIPLTPEELETRDDWYAEQRAGMTVEGIEQQRQNINTETSSPSFKAGSPLDRLQQHRNTQKMLTGRWNFGGGYNNMNITALQINNSDYYLVGKNYSGDEIIVERGRCQVTSGMITLLPDNGGGMKEVQFQGGNTLALFDIYYGTEMTFVKR